MGNVSSVINYAMKRYAKYKLRTLLCDAVHNAVNDIDCVSCCSKFKRCSDRVRQLAEDWHTMVQTFTDKCTDVTSGLVDVLNCLPSKDGEFNMCHVVCFCVFSIDLCALMLNRKQHVNVENVMRCLVETLFCRNPNACLEFLKCE